MADGRCAGGDSYRNAAPDAGASLQRINPLLHSPLIFSSYMAIWCAQVPQTLQGRVFAADYVIGTVIEATADLGAGLLADRVFEPVMRARGWPSTPMGAIAGTGPGSGLAMVCVLSAVGILLVGLSSLKIAAFRKLTPEFYSGAFATESIPGVFQ